MFLPQHCLALLNLWIKNIIFHIIYYNLCCPQVQTDFQQLTETQFITTILDADNINHIVVFLTGAVGFPEGTAGQVFFSWPDPNAPPNWQLLGYISNAKPSAIFKISNLKKLHEMSECTNHSTFGLQNICHNAQIGISIESAANVREIPSPTTTSYLSFAQKMLQVRIVANTFKLQTISKCFGICFIFIENVSRCCRVS